MEDVYLSGHLPGSRRGQIKMSWWHLQRDQQKLQIRMRWWCLLHERQKLGRIQELARDDIHLLCSLLCIGP